MVPFRKYLIWLKAWHWLDSFWVLDSVMVLPNYFLLCTVSH